MTGQPHPSLVTRALDGDPRAVDQLARAWLPHVYRWCQRLGGPRIDCEDAAHEALITMCRRLDTVRSAEQFPAWLYGICKRIIANHRRRAWLRSWVGAPVTDTPDAGNDPHRSVEAREAARIVWDALESLSAAQREVLVLCELEERSGSEVAELTGLPLGTVKSRLRLARTAFRAHIERRDASVLADEVT
ncbi:MAG: sigma-70 family RNA polymerase sigma factor [Myxococcales bacterium]|nr:sigma-70 family RNA polymerase sigma factor [Myxococcales bacterium]